jgi:cobalt/nickel transport system permease protein
MTAPRRRWWIAGLAIAAVIVVVLAPLASADPDGLEAVALAHGFLEAARGALYSILPDYTVPGLTGTASTIVAGLIGVAVVFGLLWLVGRALARKRDNDISS